MTSEVVDQAVASVEQADKKYYLRFVGGAYLRLAYVSSKQADFIRNKLMRIWKNKKYGVYYEAHQEKETWYHFHPQLKPDESHDFTEYALMLEKMKKDIIAIIEEHPILWHQLR